MSNDNSQRTIRTKLRRARVDVLNDAINSRTPAQRKALATACGTEIGNLRQIAYGYGSCSVPLAKAIIDNVDGISITDLIPELAGVQM